MTRLPSALMYLRPRLHLTSTPPTAPKYSISRILIPLATAVSNTTLKRRPWTYPSQLINLSKKPAEPLHFVCILFAFFWYPSIPFFRPAHRVRIPLSLLRTPFHNPPVSTFWGRLTCACGAICTRPIEGVARRLVSLFTSLDSWGLYI